MKINIPFQLGLEYENREFDLEPMQDRIRGYDSYIYSKKILIYGIEVINIELIFHWDILVAIILEFKKLDLSKLDKLLLLDYIQVNNYFYKSVTKINSRINQSLL